MGWSKEVLLLEYNKIYFGWINVNKYFQKFRFVYSDKGDIGFFSCGFSQQRFFSIWGIGENGIFQIQRGKIIYNYNFENILCIFIIFSKGIIFDFKFY